MYTPNNKEKEEIIEMMKTIAKELHGFLEKAAVDEIKVRIKFKFRDRPINVDPTLHIEKNDIYISRAIGYNLSIVEDGKFIFPLKDEFYLYDLEFIKNYKENRARIERKIKKDISVKEGYRKNMNEVRELWEEEQAAAKHNPANIEIDFPKSNNQHEIEITKEAGRTVGNIDFGGRTIKIITDGDIVLVDRRKEQEKTKSIKK